MKSKANSDSATRKTASQSAGPSVPISVYRELAAELQATRAMVDSLNTKNQELTLQNQKFRQEVYRFLQSAGALRSLVEPAQPPVHSPGQVANPTPSPAPLNNANGFPTLEETSAASAVAARLRSPQPAPEELFDDTESDAATSDRSSRGWGGFWLVITVLLIMVTAFGAGFLVVRPLLPTSDGAADSPAEGITDSPAIDPSVSPTDIQ